MFDLILVKGSDFWVGVSASLLATLIAAIFVYTGKNALSVTSRQRSKSVEESGIIIRSLAKSTAVAPFAYGVAQARALKYFVVAAFVAYVGDILGLFWPFNIALYCVALIYIYFSMRWFILVEKNGVSTLKKIDGE